MKEKEIVEILKSITVKDTGEHYKDEAGFDRAEKIGEALSYAIDIIEHLDHDSISRKAVIDLLKKWADGYQYIEIPTEDALNSIKELPSEISKDEWINVNDLRLMKVEECAGHTIDYAMGWKACIEWLKSGGDRKEFQQ